MASKKRQQRILGIDIGSYTIKMVEVLMTDSPRILKWGIAENLSGDTEFAHEKDPKLIYSLKQAIGKFKPATNIASICLSDPSVIVKELSMPPMGEKEMLDNIRFELAEYFSSDFKEYQMSYRLLQNSSNGNGKEKINALVAAAPMTVLRRYRDIIRKSGLNLKFIDVSINCVSKVLARMASSKREPKEMRMKEVVCLADLGAHNIEISIYENGVFLIDKNITVAGSSYNELAVYELEQVIDYFHRKNYEKRISRVILFGGRSYTDGIDGYFSKQLYLPVVTAQPGMFKSFDDIKEEFPIGLYIKALGSALREE